MFKSYLYAIGVGLGLVVTSSILAQTDEEQAQQKVGEPISPVAYGDEKKSWKDWLQFTEINSQQIAQFYSQLPSKAQDSFKHRPRSTQALSVIVLEGIKATSGNRKITSDDYYKAYKIANKAEAGYYAHSIIEVLNVK